MFQAIKNHMDTQLVETLFAAFGGGAAVVTVLQPVAIKLLDLYLLPHLKDVFVKVNPKGAWLLSGMDGEDVYTFVMSVIEAENKGYASRPEFLKRWAFKRFDAIYRLSKNAKAMSKAVDDSKKEVVTP